MDVVAARGSEKVFHCQKSGRDVAFSDPKCLNPKGYCKWRSACPIRSLEKELGRLAR